MELARKDQCSSALLGGTTLVVVLGTLTPKRVASALDVVVIVVLLDSLSLFFLFYQNVLHTRAPHERERDRVREKVVFFFKGRGVISRPQI